jgi:hypothetical protein
VGPYGARHNKKVYIGKRIPKQLRVTNIEFYLIQNNEKITSKLVAIPKIKYLHFTSYYNRRRGEENDWNPISTNVKCGPIWSSPHY